MRRTSVTVDVKERKRFLRFLLCGELKNNINLIKKYEEKEIIYSYKERKTFLFYFI